MGHYLRPCNARAVRILKTVPAKAILSFSLSVWIYIYIYIYMSMSIPVLCICSIHLRQFCYMCWCEFNPPIHALQVASFWKYKSKVFQPYISDTFPPTSPPYNSLPCSINLLISLSLISLLSLPPLFLSSFSFCFIFDRHFLHHLLRLHSSATACPALLTMVSADAVRTVVGIIGNIISLFLFLSPVPTFIRIWRKRSVEQYSPAPYLATLINCMVWTLYGLPMVHPGSILVVTINGSGTAIECVYIILFFIFSDKKKRLKVALVVLVEIVFVGALSLLVLTLVHTYKKRSFVVGMVCILFNIMMYASPLAIMKLVITTKSVEYMPFFLSLASFANGLAWTTYALIRFDPFITIPNGLGTLFGLAQLLLYAAYYKSTKRQMEARKTKEIDFSEIVVAGDPQVSKKTATATPTQINGGPTTHENRGT